MATAEKRLAGGMSVVVFPEGARTLDGRMHAFRRGAYALAMEFGLPVVPITIDGAYKVMPRSAILPRPELSGLQSMRRFMLLKADVMNSLR